MGSSVLSSCIKSSLITSGSLEATVPSSGQVKPHEMFCSRIQTSTLKRIYPLSTPFLPGPRKGSVTSEGGDGEFSPPSGARKGWLHGHGTYLGSRSWMDREREGRMVLWMGRAAGAEAGAGVSRQAPRRVALAIREHSPSKLRPVIDDLRPWGHREYSTAGDSGPPLDILQSPTTSRCLHQPRCPPPPPPDKYIFSQ